MNKRILLVSCALGAMALSGQSAWAAAATDTAAAADNGAGTTIGELVVTAERREENLQDTPIAVSAFSSDTLKSKRLDGGENLVLQVPNSNYTRSNFGGYNFKIRGIGTDVVSAGVGGAAGVSINVNELPVTFNNFANTDFFDVDRVEVVRGPQGTLYGRNATGGAVDVITTKPSQTFGGFGTVEYGNYNTLKLTGAVNIPLGDAFAIRIAGVRLTQDGFGENSYLASRVDGRSRRDPYHPQLQAERPFQRLPDLRTLWRGRQPQPRRQAAVHQGSGPGERRRRADRAGRRLHLQQLCRLPEPGLLARFAVPERRLRNAQQQRHLPGHGQSSWPPQRNRRLCQPSAPGPQPA